MLKGFRDFILRGNVVDLAVAVILGAAFNAIVTSLVKDVLTQLIAAVAGKPDFSSLVLKINGTPILIGNFLNAAICVLDCGQRGLFWDRSSSEQADGQG